MSVGQGHRLRVNVMKSENVHWDATLTSESIVYGPVKET